MAAIGSSSTWSRISTNSSSSDPPPGPRNVPDPSIRPSRPERAAGLIRLGHPFPSLLNGGVTGILALIAGGTASRAATLGVAMVALQVSIGALNDLTDVERDRDRKPGKPIPAGAVGRGTARIAVAAGLLVGMTLSALAGVVPALVALMGTTTGYAYDLRLKATPWAWLPFAVGLPLLPVYAWVGAIGRLPGAFLGLLPLAVAAGAAVALSNGLVDLDRDRAAGVATPALRLGARRALRLAAGLSVAIATGVGLTLTIVGASPTAWLVALGGTTCLAAGLPLLGSSAAARREIGWEASAVGIGLLAASWALGLAGRGLL
jgi:4-hydroxybenzoate polyprenyltransferase